MRLAAVVGWTCENCGSEEKAGGEPDASCGGCGEDRGTQLGRYGSAGPVLAPPPLAVGQAPEVLLAAPAAGLERPDRLRAARAHLEARPTMRLEFSGPLSHKISAP